ncbi:MAG: hypothetical protein VZR95_00345 [Alphaproteobacteria bacterium]
MNNKIVTETFLKAFQLEAEKAFFDLDEEYPHPAHLPIGLLSRVENGHWETAYTRTLAYLLGDNNHGYGYDFLRALLKKVDCCRNIVDCRVYAEKALSGSQDGRFDIYAAGQCIIEAKTANYNITSVRKQLHKYDEELAKIEPNGIDKLFLTIYPEDDKKIRADDWKNITWSDICDILWKVIKNKKNRAGYWYVKYFMVSIYADLYGYDAEYINIYDFLTDDKIKKYACQIKEHYFDFKLFKKYPTAFMVLYDAVQEEYDNEKTFTKSYNECVKQLKKMVYAVFPTGKQLNKSRSWNAFLLLSNVKDIYFNAGITNKMQKKNKHFKDGLYWFDNLNFSGKERFENQRKWCIKMSKYFDCDKYSNGFLGLIGTNVILNTIEFDEENAAQTISNDLRITTKLARNNDGL